MVEHFHALIYYIFFTIFPYNYKEEAELIMMIVECRFHPVFWSH